MFHCPPESLDEDVVEGTGAITTVRVVTVEAGTPIIADAPPGTPVTHVREPQQPAGTIH